jgi:hypothetical protein
MVNANPVTETFMNLSKPFLKKDLANKVLAMRTLRNDTSSRKVCKDVGSFVARNRVWW